MRLTPTHSGPDSAGVVRIGNWELEGRSYLVVLGGAVGGILVFILAVGLTWPPRLIVALLPLALAIGFVRFFLIGRPPHFTSDWLEGLFAGHDFMQQSGRPARLVRLGAAQLIDGCPGGLPRRAQPKARGLR